MNQAMRLSTLNLDCETVIANLTRQFSYHTLRVVRSFDLQSACASFTELTCPHHDDSPCDCQLVVLLIYGVEATPVSLMLHSHRGITEIDLVTYSGNRPERNLEKIIRLVFESGFGSSNFLIEVSDVT